MGVLMRVRAGGQEIERGLAMTRQERSAVRAQRSRIDQRRGYDRPGLRAERYVHDRRATYILATLHDGDLGGVRLGRARSIFVGLIQVIADRARPLGVRAGLAMITHLLRALQGLGVRPHEIAPSIEQAISMYQTRYSTDSPERGLPASKARGS